MRFLYLVRPRLQVTLSPPTILPLPASRRRELAQFHNFESYHWRISLGEKWGIALLPWFGVVFLAEHINNITYTLQGFAKETIKGFG